jgi:putative DNA primase/helicase
MPWQAARLFQEKRRSLVAAAFRFFPPSSPRPKSRKDSRGNNKEFFSVTTPMIPPSEGDRNPRPKITRKPPTAKAGSNPDHCEDEPEAAPTPAQNEEVGYEPLADDEEVTQFPDDHEVDEYPEYEDEEPEEESPAEPTPVSNDEVEYEPMAAEEDEVEVEEMAADEEMPAEVEVEGATETSRPIYDPSGAGVLIWTDEPEDGLWVAADSQGSHDVPTLFCELSDEIRGTTAVFNFRVQQAHSWPPYFCGGLFGLLRAADGRYTVEVAGQHFPRMFPALLTLVQKYDTFVEQGNLLWAIKSAAALEYGQDNVSQAVAEIRQAYHDAEVHPPDKKDLAKDILRLAGEELRTAKQLVPEIAAKFLASLQPENTEDKCLALWNGLWFRYDGSTWVEWSDRELRAEISKYWQSQPCADKVTLTKTLREDLIVNLEGICRQVPGKQAMPAWSYLDGTYIDSPFLAVANGRLDLSPMFRGEPPDFYPPNSRHFATASLPVECQPDAECPLWLKTLGEIFRSRSQDADVKKGMPAIVDQRIRVLQQFFGWILLPNRLRLEKCLILYGQGANGKGLIMNTLRKLVGLQNISTLQLERMGGAHATTQLLGKLVNLPSEIGRVDRFEEGVFKQIISGDPITMNPKHKPAFTTLVGVKLIFGTNNLPPINDKTRGTKRKLITMPAMESFEGREDLGRERALEEELPGILNWALLGALDLIACKGFVTCDLCNQAAEKHGLDCDPLEQWILDKCLIEPTCKTDLQDAYGNYADWSETTGHGKLSLTNFATQLSNRPGIRIIRPGTEGPRPRIVFGLRCDKVPGSSRRN